MVEVFAVASGKGGTGKTTSTVALGMALSDRYDVTVVDADTGMANLLFHAGLSGAETTLHDVLADDAPVGAATYDRFGLTVVPCGTTLSSSIRRRRWTVAPPSSRSCWPTASSSSSSRPSPLSRTD
jgi:MinD-like ATPase involved in chromosome partitioning or flagellar assembly